MYSGKLISELKQRIIRKISIEVDKANEEDNLECILDKYGIVFEDTLIMPVNTRTMKVIVFGSLAGKKKDYQGILNKLGIDLLNVDFIYNYADLKRYPVASLRHSSQYSDILFGPVPHSQVLMGDTNSFLAAIKRNPSDYPRLQELSANGQLKITKTNFESAIQKTRYYEALTT